ncbi:MAG: adenylosuccinate synthase [Bacillota bacterium]
MLDYTALSVVGCQWGDEGKGKITDFLAAQADVVVRYQGGPNAGHTVTIENETFKLHHLPCGILYQGKTCIIGNGMVLDAPILLSELANLEKRGITAENLFISDRAHLILPYHRRQDSLEEEKRGDQKIGTTLRGIGPAYQDKIARRGIRAGELRDLGRLIKRIAEVLKEKNELFQRYYGDEGITMQEIEEEYIPVACRLLPYITDTALLLANQLAKGAKVIFEGAQGAMLDIDYGTYPYVTSSGTLAGNICSGAGIPPGKVGTILGVGKAYSTRVGAGPFPTEIEGPTAELIRERGREFGTTTGRPRRIGWLDGVALRQACRLNGVQHLALTLFDVLSGVGKLQIATAYRGPDGSSIEHFPAELHILEKSTPVYREFTGWSEDISRAKSIKDLPQAALEYIRGVEETAGAHVSLLSVGPRRDQTFWRL